MTALPASALVLVNRVRAYEREIQARTKALEAAEKATAFKGAIADKQFLLEFDFDFVDGVVPQAQAKTFVIDRSMRWFLCREITLSLGEVGTNAGSGVAINYTVNPLFRPQQLSGTVDIRDSYRDRAWSNFPLPDAYFAAQTMAPRRLPCSARLPGGTEVQVNYAPVSAIARSASLGYTTVSFRVVIGFRGVEVRGG